MFKMKPVNMRYVDNAAKVFAIALIVSVLAATASLTSLVMIENFPTSFYIVFGTILVWCLIYKIFEYIDSKKETEHGPK